LKIVDTALHLSTNHQSIILFHRQYYKHWKLKI